MSFYWKTRTLLSGDFREIQLNLMEYNNKRKIKKYKGKKDIYCIFQIHTDEGGLFCLFLKVLGGLKYCAANGFIPVVDTQSRENIFQTKEERGKLNSWELFFKQPAGITYDEVKKLPNAIILHNPQGPRTDMPFLDNPNMVKYWRTMVDRFIKYSDDVQKIIDEHESRFFDSSKTVGILARGTDYKKGVAVGHPIQPTIDEITKCVDEAIDKHGCTKIFLATEDQNIFDAITTKYGNMVYSVPQKRYSEEITDKLGHRPDYAAMSKDMNKSYLASIHMLSKCDCIVGGQTTGMMGAYLMSDGYEYEHIFFKGSYDVDDEETCNIKNIDELEKHILR